MMKKTVSVILVLMMAMGLMAGCSSSEAKTENSKQESTKATDEKQDTTFTLEYPKDMQELGFTEPLVLDKEPERIVCLSAAPVLALHELGANIVGVTSSMVVEWPEDLMEKAETVTFSVMSDGEFDFESVIALEPDLVMLASAAAETAGAKLESLGINVYYVYAGHTVSYDSVKMQTEALVKAFSNDDDSKKAGEAIMARFTKLEESLASAQKAFEGKKVLVLQSGSATAHYVQTEEGTLGSMLAKLGFGNVYENASSSMVQLDYEQALDYQPDYIVCVGASDAETHMKTMQEAFDKNPDYWNAMPAVANGDVICVGVTYISSAGINIIDNISNLITIMSEHTGIAVE